MFSWYDVNVYTMKSQWFLMFKPNRVQDYGDYLILSTVVGIILVPLVRGCTLVSLFTSFIIYHYSPFEPNIVQDYGDYLILSIVVGIILLQLVRGCTLDSFISFIIYHDSPFEPR